MLGAWVDAFLRDESGYFFTERGEVVISFFLTDLEFPFLEDLFWRVGEYIYIYIYVKVIRTSLMISFTSFVLNAFWRSPVLATSPFETLVKTLEIWSTLSRSVSLKKKTGSVKIGKE